MIKFRDFAPALLESGFFSGNTYESLRDSLDKANDWIAARKIQVINIETVVLPNIRDYGQNGTNSPELVAPSERKTFWYQFIRVWYQAE